MYVNWPSPLPDGGTGEEMALAFDWNRAHRLLVIAPLFNEANTFRHQLSEIMRQLSLAGIDCFMPDLPGCNESAQPLEQQTFANWRKAVSAAAQYFSVSHVFALRSSAALTPAVTPAWVYAPNSPGQALRTMLRARVIAAREAGIDENSEDLLAEGRQAGLDLGGWHLGPTLIGELHHTSIAVDANHTVIEHEEIGGAPLWLRAEPDSDLDQATKIARVLAAGIMAQ